MVMGRPPHSAPALWRPILMRQRRRAPDGRLVIVYVLTIRPITVDMSKLSGPTAARWYDPRIGEYIKVGGSPFSNTGSRQFTPPGKNHDGDGDWVLVLEAS